MQSAHEFNCQLLQAFDDERIGKRKRGPYWKTQIDMAYNSNKMEGVRLTHDQTRVLYETHSIYGDANLDDVTTVHNHFLMFDYMLETLDEPLSETIIKRMNGILRDRNTGPLLLHTDPGEYKTIPNEVGNITTAPPSEVAKRIQRLLASYNKSSHYGYEQMAAFHLMFETIHPFQDGNGRVGRMLLFRECLVHDLVPPLIKDESKADYYRALGSEGDNVMQLARFFERCAAAYEDDMLLLLTEQPNAALRFESESKETMELAESYLGDTNDKHANKPNVFARFFRRLFQRQKPKQLDSTNASAAADSDGEITDDLETEDREEEIHDYTDPDYASGKKSVSLGPTIEIDRTGLVDVNDPSRTVADIMERNRKAACKPMDTKSLSMTRDIGD